MTPHRDDFARWLDDPVTRWVIAAHLKIADECRETWMGASWENGGGSRELLIELRVRADTYKAIADTTYEGLCATNGETPNEE